jgi:hypothetical protein
MGAMGGLAVYHSQGCSIGFHLASPSSVFTADLTLNQNYSTHSYGFLVSTTTSLVVSILLLVIKTRLIVELT